MYPYLNINIRGAGPYPAQSSSKAPDNLPAGRRFENDEIPMSNANRFWYVLQTSFHRELQIQLQLNRMRIRSFIPMHYEETTESGRRRIRRKPAVHNLIFVRISPVWLQKIKTAKLIPAKCMYDKTTQMPLIVPDKQMDDFIALTEGKFEDVLLIDPSTEELERGDMVRITSGMFAGIEGEYIRYRSKNRVVVRIEGFAAVATAEVPEAYIEKISAEAHPVGSPV